MAVQKKLFTVDEFDRLLELPENEDRRFELINGEIVEMSPKLNHGLIGSFIHGSIFVYLTSHPIGKAMFEVDHYVPEDAYNTRRPDVSFISHERMQNLKLTANVPLMPDLAVEVKSPSNYYTGSEGLRQKAEYYLAHGSRLVWIVDPETETIEVYEPDESPETLRIGDTLTGADVLPGFTVSVAQIFAR